MSQRSRSRYARRIRRINLGTNPTDTPDLKQIRADKLMIQFWEGHAAYTTDPLHQRIYVARAKALRTGDPADEAEASRLSTIHSLRKEAKFATYPEAKEAFTLRAHYLETGDPASKARVTS